jgi:16S rRNA C1402 (ribose-2'-O) methylase RsmI
MGRRAKKRQRELEAIRYEERAKIVRSLTKEMESVWKETMWGPMVQQVTDDVRGEMLRVAEQAINERIAEDDNWGERTMRYTVTRRRQ